MNNAFQMHFNKRINNFGFIELTEISKSNREFMPCGQSICGLWREGLGG